MINLGMSHRTNGNRAAGDDAIVNAALQCLVDSCHFQHRTQLLRLENRDGCLIIEGRLPSFYLKQVLQTLLRDVDGVVQIDNRVDVV